MNGIVILIDLHTSGTGFQIIVDVNGEHKKCPEIIEDIKDALPKAFYLQTIIERETNTVISANDIRVSQSAIEYNATITSDNMKLYRAMQVGKIKALKNE
jgi:hypothetical protein